MEDNKELIEAIKSLESTVKKSTNIILDALSKISRHQMIWYEYQEPNTHAHEDKE